MSFRLKLVLTMFLLVAGVTGGTLYVTHRHVREAYLALLQQEFTAEIREFVGRQETRLVELQEKCATIARSEVFRARLQKKNPKDIYDTLYNEPSFASVAGLVRLPRPFLKARELMPASLPGEVFVRVLDAQGAIVNPPDARTTPALRVERAHLDRQLAFVTGAFTNLDEREVGFLAPATETGLHLLHEIVVTKVTDPDTRTPLGALIVGVPFRDSSRHRGTNSVTIEASPRRRSAGRGSPPARGRCGRAAGSSPARTVPPRSRG